MLSKLGCVGLEELMILILRIPWLGGMAILKSINPTNLSSDSREAI